MSDLWRILVYALEYKAPLISTSSNCLLPNRGVIWKYCVDTVKYLNLLKQNYKCLIVFTMLLLSCCFCTTCWANKICCCIISAGIDQLLCRRYGSRVLWWRCLSVISVHEHISGTTHPISAIFLHVICAHGLALLWQYSNILCISGFMDDVMFAHNGTGIGDSIVTQQVVAWIYHRDGYWNWANRGQHRTGAESDVCDFLIQCCFFHFNKWSVIRTS